MNQLIVVVVVLCNIKLYNAAVSLNIARAEIKAVRVNFYARIVFTVFISKELYCLKRDKIKMVLQVILTRKTTSS